SYVNAIVAGEWEQSWDWIAPTWDDMEKSITGFQVREGLSEENRALLDEFIAQVVAYAEDPADEGSIFLWEGPLSLQDGTVLAEEGEKVALEDIWYLSQLLEGMTGASE